MRIAISIFAVCLCLMAYSLRKEPETVELLTVGDLHEGPCKGMWVKFNASTQTYSCYSASNHELVKTVNARR